MGLTDGWDVVLSFSGGKDSGAAGLYMKELGIPFQAVFCDTGWEAAETMEYVQTYAPSFLGPIQHIRADIQWSKRVRLSALRAAGASAEEVRQQEEAEAERLAELFESWAREIEALLGVSYSAMVRRAIKSGTLATRLMRWCTADLKARVMKRHLAGLENPLNVVGIRAEESAARAAMPESEHDKGVDCEVWRPLLRWTLQEVIDIYQRHNVRPNPLYYKQGAERVGCYPCIMSRKSEIAALPLPRIEAVRLLEQRVAESRAIRMSNSGDVEDEAPPTFFQSRKKRPDGSYHYPIDEVYAWAHTKRGGKVLELFAPGEADTGCMRWGLCDFSRADP